MSPSLSPNRDRKSRVPNPWKARIVRPIRGTRPAKRDRSTALPPIEGDLALVDTDARPPEGEPEREDEPEEEPETPVEVVAPERLEDLSDREYAQRFLPLVASLDESASYVRIGLFANPRSARAALSDFVDLPQQLSGSIERRRFVGGICRALKRG